MTHIRGLVDQKITLRYTCGVVHMNPPHHKALAAVVVTQGVACGTVVWEVHDIPGLLQHSFLIQNLGLKNSENLIIRL